MALGRDRGNPRAATLGGGAAVTSRDPEEGAKVAVGPRGTHAAVTQLLSGCLLIKLSLAEAAEATHIITRGAATTPTASQ